MGLLEKILDIGLVYARNRSIYDKEKDVIYVITMQKSHSFVKGMLTGMIAGAAIGIMISPMDSSSRKAFKKSANKMMRMAQNMF